jgi:multicomponent Na+:H+ antiporter subunit E
LYIFWLLREILKSTFDVLKIVWSRDMNLSENMDWLDTNTSDESFLTIYGNSITLTPGTATLDIKNNMILVHSLRKASFDDLKKGEMENKIKGILQLNADSSEGEH